MNEMSAPIEITSQPQYKLLYGTSTLELNDQVNKYLAEGWNLFGSPAIASPPGTPDAFIQAVVKGGGL